MENIRHVALLIRREEDLLEGSRSALGLAAENFYVHMFVLGLEVPMSKMFRDNLEWLDDMEARVYSDHARNAEVGFHYMPREEIGEKLKEMDLVIPF